VPIYQSEISPPNHVSPLPQKVIRALRYLFPAGCFGMHGIYRKCLWIRVVRGQQDVLISKLSQAHLLIVVGLLLFVY